MRDTIQIPEYDGAGVYEISCGNPPKIYIGQSQNIKTRLENHVNSLKADKHSNRQLQTAFNSNKEIHIRVITKLPKTASLDSLLACEMAEIASAQRRGDCVNVVTRRASYSDYYDKRFLRAQKAITTALNSLKKAETSWRLYCLPMDGSGEPENTPASTAYEFILNTINAWMREEGKP